MPDNSASMAQPQLDALQSEDMRALLNVVDELRHAGLNSLLSLPQLVVCGDQSSGKSSVLEAITQIPFPRNANLCTRFATEIILRRESRQSITAKIIPDESQPASRRKKLQDMQASFDDITKLPMVMEHATKMMETTDPSAPSQMNAFFSDVLSVTVSGPSMSPLTLVDLPGLVHSENRLQNKQDVQFIRRLVDKYIANPRSIILAVVSAKHDYANQIILQKARDVDPQGSRTLGIITKPDCLDSGSEEERLWVALAQNKDIKFELGWHMLRNRTQLESALTPQERDDMEKLFFAGSSYQLVDPNILGIDSLRHRLSRVLFAHLRCEIPKLERELTAELKKTDKRLAELGEKRATTKDTRSFLIRASMEYQRIVKDSLTGSYNDDFFLKHTGTSSVNCGKLRAAIHFQNSGFAVQMQLFGAKFEFTHVPAEVQEVLGDNVMPTPHSKLMLNLAKDNQVQMTRTLATKWVTEKIQQSRGEELPGCFSATLMKELYWEQTSRWESLTLVYVNKVAAQCVSQFSQGVLNHVMPVDVANRVWAYKVRPSLDRQLKKALGELGRVLNDKKGAPQTYNHYYTDTIQKLRHAKLLAKARAIVDKHTFNDNSKKKVVDADVLMESLKNELIEPDMDKFTAEDALDCLMALYKDKLKNYVAAVTETVVERHLIKPLLDCPISPLTLTELSDDEIRSLAAEPENVSRERDHLVNIKANLEKGREAFQRAMVAFN